MRRTWLLAALPVVLLAACDLGDTATIRRQSAEAAAMPAVDTVAPAAFVALVPPPAGPGTCAPLLDTEAQMERAMGVRVLNVEFAGDGVHHRKVGMVVDSAGTPTMYQDMRVRQGGVTQVVLDFANGRGTARNHAEVGSSVADGDPAAMAGLANLGDPRGMMDTIRARCGRRAET